MRSLLSKVFPNFYLHKGSHCLCSQACTCSFKSHPCIRSPAKNPASLEKAGQGRLSGFCPGLPRKCSLVKLGKYGHSQAFLATLATKAWPSWPCYFQGRAFSATLVKKAWPNPGLKDSSQAWPGFFEFPGQKFITLSDCNIKPKNLWPFVVP